ncbi:MAG: protoporphyrinogen oxidase HemJ [Nitrospiria bacterium]
MELEEGGKLLLLLWLKALHIVAFVSWFAGLFYLPRLFVYFAESPDPGVKKTLLTMQLKLWRVIMVPASVLTAFFGLALLDLTWESNLFRLWFQIKVILLIFLYGYHFYLRHVLKGFERGEEPKSGKFYRILNEIPTILLVLIVILVVVKPFK